MFTMDRRTSSENRGLFSETCFISLSSARVSAFTSAVSTFSSSMYWTTTLMGLSACRTRRMRNLFSVEMKMFTPPSGRLILRTIRAAVPTCSRSPAVGFSPFSVVVSTRPRKLSAAMAFSTVSTSDAAGSTRGVRMPGKAGFPRRGMRKSRAGRIWSAGTM